ncbi:sensor domain-containing diguanylate cyclase [Niallia endozanthoxylica]|uniref:Sensor domain-containing diguanylate cyclase n=1 Tax=Niallia endozanthoxylica TaxID=2036016 RepID=A0A5J5HY76_9BACI|nr:diguanylate cyclase [Niallia endozanthoxylica]KAA9027473.1 sensor domain-containing diguanylate cyclase [Niallia endozanthoxylica]
MELLEERIILNLKSRFFDMISTDDHQLKYESILEEMIMMIKQLMQAEEVTLYHFDERIQQLVVEASTNSDVKQNLVAVNFSNQDHRELGTCQKVYRKPFYCQAFEQYDLLIPVRNNGSIQSYLALKEEGQFFSKLTEKVLEKLSVEGGLFLQKAQKLAKLLVEEKRYKQLFRVTEKVHSTMNMKSVLGEIIDTLQEVYPTFTYILFLSQDYNDYEGLPIKEFNYTSENQTIMQSYVTGTIQVEVSATECKANLYAPLKGKQGVYGVLQVTSSNALVFPKNEVEFITVLANIAGGAIENAQLYEQSKRLIADLQLINETSHHLNSNLRLSETMIYMSEQIVKSLAAKEVGFIQFASDTSQNYVQQGSTDFFFTDEAKTYIDFFKERILKENDSLFIGDLKLPEDTNADSSFKSAMAVPMSQSNVLSGFVLVLHHEPYAFSFDTFKLFLSLIHHSTLAFTNTLLREKLEKLVVTDHLTKLYSRKYLDEQIQQSMQFDEGATFILIDIDNFKLVNDTYGHQIGDEVIIQVANVIKENIRGTDIGARWGGEELAIYLPRVPIDTGVIIAERLVQKVRESTNPTVTISCGVTCWKTEDNDTYQNLFKRADNALYQAKKTGKNKVVTQLC